MRIGLARRGYSATGGAENYLRRLAGGLEQAGHETVLFVGTGWPRAQWSGERFDLIAGANSPQSFADQVDKRVKSGACDFLFSLERLWRCDCYRAGDGVHKAWLARRALVEPKWKRLVRAWNPKHRQILALEKSLFAKREAKTVIANSRLVRDEIIELYDYPEDRIAVVHNGLTNEYFAAVDACASPKARSAARTALNLREDDSVVLFAGTGWERKGLRAAIAAFSLLVEQKMVASPVLVVAGRGNPRPYLNQIPSPVRERIRFLGPVSNMIETYTAADIFLLPTVYDPFSNACLEALASGLPVITTKGNGFSEILVSGESGEVLNQTATDFAESLANTLHSWLSTGRANKKREHCRQMALNYTIADNVRVTMNFLGTMGLLTLGR